MWPIDVSLCVIVRSLPFMLDFSHHIEGKEIVVTCPHTVPEDETE